MPQPSTRERLTAFWPPASLRVRAGDLELRYLDDDLLLDLAELAGRGVHATGEMPFLFPWTRGTPEEVARSVLVYQWRARGAITPDRWALELAVLHRGEPVGIQAVETEDFPRLRAVSTGSWLGRAHHGRGIGTRMRALVLYLAFEGFGAQVATTSAWADNGPSNAVSAKLGYRTNGASRLVREGVATEHRHYRMDRADYDALAAAHAELLGQVRLDGIDELRDFLQLSTGG